MIRHALSLTAVCLLLLGQAQVKAQAKSLLIENVTLIDGTGAAPVTGASVLVEGDRFAAVSTGSISVPSGTERIDGTGKFLIPGVIDSHIHGCIHGAGVHVAQHRDRQI